MHKHALYSHMGDMMLLASGVFIGGIFLCVHGCVCNTQCCFGHMCTERCQVGSSELPDLLKPAKTWQGCKLPRLGSRQPWPLLVMFAVSNETPCPSNPLPPSLVIDLTILFLLSRCFTDFPLPPGRSSLPISPNVCCTLLCCFHFIAPRNRSAAMEWVLAVGSDWSNMRHESVLLWDTNTATMSFGTHHGKKWTWKCYFSHLIFN